MSSSFTREDYLLNKILPKIDRLASPTGHDHESSMLAAFSNSRETDATSAAEAAVAGHQGNSGMTMIATTGNKDYNVHGQEMQGKRRKVFSLAVI
jgi:hypothetical protein